MTGNTRALIVSATALAAGFCAGVGTGILIAPKSGARTRRDLRNFAEDMAEDTAEAVDEIIDRGKRWPRGLASAWSIGSRRWTGPSA